MWGRRFFTIIGASALIIGVWLPTLGIPLLRDQSFFQMSKTGASIIMALGVASLLAGAFRKFGLLYITGVLAAAVLVYAVIETNERKSRVESDLKQRMADTPFKSASRAVVGGVKIEYGWMVMMGGALMLMAVPLFGTRLTGRIRAPGDLDSSCPS